MFDSQPLTTISQIFLLVLLEAHKNTNLVKIDKIDIESPPTFSRMCLESHNFNVRRVLGSLRYIFCLFANMQAGNGRDGLVEAINHCLWGMYVPGQQYFCLKI